jgi:hypothetical protein
MRLTRSPLNLNLLTPTLLNFKFTSEAKGSSKFCNLVVSAVKVPGGPAAVARGVALAGGVALIAVASRRSSGDDAIIFGYEVKAFETRIENGNPSASKPLKIRGAEISSTYFSSTGTVDRVGTEGAVYTVKNAGISGFTATMIRGSDPFPEAAALRGARLTRAYRSTGDGMNPMCSQAHPGCWIVAPLWPQAVQRAQRRSLSLDGLCRATGS